MRSVLRLRQLAVQPTWCISIPAARNSSFSIRQSSSARPSSSSDDDFYAHESLDSSATAGPSRIPFESDQYARDQQPLDTEVNNAQRGLSFVRTAYDFDEEQAILPTFERQLLALGIRKRTDSIPHTERTWQLYQMLSVEARRALPHGIHLALLHQIVPEMPDVRDGHAWAKTHAEHCKRWGTPLRLVVADMYASEHGFSLDALRVAMRNYAELGDVDAAESICEHHITEYGIAVSEVVRFRLEALSAWLKIVVPLDARKPKRMRRRARQKEEYEADRKRAKENVPDRVRAAAPIAEAVFGAISSILRDFMRGTTSPTEETMQELLIVLDHTCEVYNGHKDRPAVESMLEKVFEKTYLIDLEYLTQGSQVAGRVNSLKRLPKHVALALVRFLIRRGEGWRATAVIESLDSGRWRPDMGKHLLMPREAAKKNFANRQRIQKWRQDLMEKRRKRRDGSADVILSRKWWKSLEAFNAVDRASRKYRIGYRHLQDAKAESGRIRYLGGLSGNELAQMLSDDDRPAIPDRPVKPASGRRFVNPYDPTRKGPLVLAPKVLFNGRKRGRPAFKRRTFADYCPSDVLLPLDRDFDQIAAIANRRRWKMLDVPHKTEYRQMDDYICRSVLTNLRKMSGVETILHFSRLYLDKAITQQAYWLERVFMESDRLRLVKEIAFKEEKEAAAPVEPVPWDQRFKTAGITRQGVEAEIRRSWIEQQEQRPTAVLENRQQKWIERDRLGFISAVKRRGTYLSDEELSRMAEKRYPTRSLSADGHTWSYGLVPPDVKLDYLPLKAALFACLDKGASVQVREIEDLIAHAALRVYEEHVVLTGREPTGIKLEPQAYVSQMLSQADAKPGAPMEPYLCTPPLPESRSGFDPLKYLVRLNDRYGQLMNLLHWQIQQRRARAVTRRGFRRRLVLKSKYRKYFRSEMEENRRVARQREEMQEKLVSRSLRERAELQQQEQQQQSMDGMGW